MENTKSLYACSYKEVMTILGCLSIEDLSKIPLEKLEFFLENMDDAYEYKIDNSKSFQEQEMMPITEAILANLFSDYLEITFQAKEGAEIDLEQMAKIAEEEIATEELAKAPETEINIIEYKKPFFEKIIEKIRKWFWKWKHTDKEL